MKKFLFLPIFLMCLMGAKAQYVGANSVQSSRIVSSSDNYWFVRPALSVGYDFTDLQGLVQVTAGKTLSAHFDLGATAMVNVMDNLTSYLCGTLRGYTNYLNMTSRAWIELMAGGMVYDGNSNDMGYYLRMGLGMRANNFEVGIFGAYTGEVAAGVTFSYTFPIL